MAESSTSGLPADTGSQPSDHDHSIHKALETQRAYAESAYVQARQRWKIAELEGKVEILESGRAVKERHGS